MSFRSQLGSDVGAVILTSQMEKLRPGEFNHLIKVAQPVCVQSELKLTHYARDAQTQGSSVLCDQAHLMLDDSTNLNVFLTCSFASSSPLQFKVQLPSGALFFLLLLPNMHLLKQALRSVLTHSPPPAPAVGRDLRRANHHLAFG